MKIKNYRWLVVVLIFFATTINYIDRQIIGLLKPILEKEFNWTESEYAYIVMAFTAAYAIGLLLVGRLIDKIGTRKGYAIIMVFWSIAGMAHAFARNVLQFVIARIVLGFGEAGNFPAGMKAISEWFPKKERGIATGILNSGPSIGVVMALLIVPLILAKFSWHWVFLITGGIGFIWLIFWLMFYQIPAKQKRLTQEEFELIKDGASDDEATEQKTLEVKVKWSKLFSFPQTWALIAGKGLIDPIFWFFLFWLPSYFSTTYALDLTRPSLELIIIYSATTLGSFLGGYFSSILVRRGWGAIDARKRTLLIFAITAGFAVISAQFTTAAWMAVAVISIAVAVHQAWATNVFTMASDMFPKETVGSAVGIAGMAGAVGGIFFPLLVGFLLDTFKASGNITAGYNMLFTICGFTYLTAWLIIHFLTKNRSALKLEDFK